MTHQGAFPVPDSIKSMQEMENKPAEVFYPESRVAATFSNHKPNILKLFFSKTG